jgi:acyl-CoA synthetase (AMP-forming)/AMP-acid ligase II
MIVPSPYPDVEVPASPITPYILRHATRLADKPAIIDGLSGETLTFGELADRVRTVAGALAAQGFRKGNVFALYAPNMPDYAIAFHAVVSLGGIVTLVNPAATAEELTRHLNDAGASYVLTVPSCLERVAVAVGRSRVRDVFVAGGAPGYTAFSTLLAGAGVPPAAPIRPH